MTRKKITKIIYCDNPSFSQDYTEITGYLYKERAYYDNDCDYIDLPEWLVDLIIKEIKCAELRGQEQKNIGYWIKM